MLNNSLVIGKNLLELIDLLRTVRNDVVTPETGLVTFPQLKILRVLASHPEGMRLKELAAALRLTPGAASIAINHLVRQELLERTTDPNDRRAVTIKLTPQGWRCREVHFQFWDSVMTEVLEEIPVTDQETFIAVLKKINREFARRQS